VFFKKNRTEILTKFKEIGINLDPYVPAFESYNQLTTDSSKIIPREQTQAFTKQIISAQNILLTNYHLFIAARFEKKNTFVDKQSFANLSQVGSALGIQMPKQFHGNNFPNSLIHFDFDDTKKQLLLIHNLPDELKDVFEKIQKNTAVIILNLNSQNLPKSFDEIGNDISVKDEIHDFIDKLNKRNRYGYSFYSKSRLPILELQVPLDKVFLKKLIDGIIDWSRKALEEKSNEDVTE